MDNGVLQLKWARGRFFIDHILRIWSGGKVAVKGEWADRVLRFAHNGVRGDNDVDV